MAINQFFFGGTAYLGIPSNEKFKKLVLRGIDLYGTNCGASRNNNVTLDIYSIAEAEAAKRCGSEDAIIVSSGYLAAQLVVQHYLGEYEFIYAPDTHPALWIGKPNSPAIDFQKWTESVIPVINGSDKPVLLITNSLNNLIPEIYPFEWLENIRADKKIILLADDSHGLGLTGKSGAGVYTRIPQLPNVEVIVIASMAKALGVDAGVILGKNHLIESLRETPVYVGSSPPSPGLLYAYVNALEIYSEELEKLLDNTRTFAGLMRGHAGVDYLEDFPVFLLNDPASSDYLFQQGMVISTFPYPDPNGKLLNRIVINSTHTHEQIEELAQKIKEF